MRYFLARHLKTCEDNYFTNTYMFNVLHACMTFYKPSEHLIYWHLPVDLSVDYLLMFFVMVMLLMDLYDDYNVSKL